MSSRRQVSVSVNVEAHDALVQFCTAYGISITAMVQEIMWDMKAINEGRFPMTKHMREVVARARAEDARRRFRPVTKIT
jgi:hypothetical protein